MDELRHSHQPVEFALETIASIIDVVAHEQNLEGPDLYDFRGALFAAIDNPCSETWERAHRIIIRSPNDGEKLNLWSAVLHFTSYDYHTRFANQPWPKVPSPGQILATLAHYHRESTLVRPMRELAPWESQQDF